MEEVKRLWKLRALAVAVYSHGDKMTAERRNLLLEKISDLHGKLVSDHDLPALCAIDPKRDAGFETFGKSVVEHIQDFNAFAKDWRKHFVDTMQPRFLSPYWKIDRDFQDNWVPQRYLKRSNRPNRVVSS